MRFLALASLLAAANGFATVPHTEPAEEYPCRNKRTAVAKSHAKRIADCVASGIASEEECTAELAAMMLADSVGCGTLPPRTTYTGGTSPTGARGAQKGSVGQGRGN